MSLKQATILAGFSLKAMSANPREESGTSVCSSLTEKSVVSNRIAFGMNLQYHFRISKKTDSDSRFNEDNLSSESPALIG